MRRIYVALVSVLFVFSIPGISNAAPDVLIIDNGDRLTGELKSLERGKLRFDTDATGVIPVEWDNVATVQSNQNVQVETADGSRYLGRLLPGADSGQLIVSTATGQVSLDLVDVVLMATIETETLDRLDGRVSVGYNFSRASKVQQFQLGLDMDFRTETKIIGMDADASLSDSEDNEASTRTSLDLQYTRLHSNRWLSGGILRFNSNDELGLNSRTSLGVGGGRILRQTNSTTLQLIGGLQGSRESLAGGLEREDTAEAFLTLTWDWFRYDSPQLDLSTRFQVIPNLTNTGRVRSEVDITFSWEMITDLYWQLSYYRSSDSENVVPDAPRIDYGVSTSLGYSF